MATIIKIKRSSGTSTPNLGQGEIGYSWGTGTYTDAQSATVTSYGKMFLGTGTETGGIAANIEIIGGKYFTDMLDHGHGTLTANSGVIVDSAKKIDEWNVDNITLNGNTISTTNANGDLTIDTNGSGDVVVSGSTNIGANLFNVTDGTSTRFSVDSFSGAVDITSGTLSTADTLLNISSTWNNAGATFYGIDLDVTNTASGANSRLLNLSVGGTDKFNVDVNGNIYAAGNISYGTATSFNIQDNTTDSFVVKEGTNNYIDIDTNNNAEKLTLGNNLTSVDIVVEDNAAAAFVLKEGSNEYLKLVTTDNSELLNIGNAISSVNVVVEDNVSGAFVLKEGSAEYFNLTTTDNAEKVTIGNSVASVDVVVEDNVAAAFVVKQGANEYIKVTTTDSSELITLGTSNVVVSNDLAVNGGDLTTNQTTFNLLNATATTVNFAGAATTVEIGAATGTTNINNNLDVDGDVNIDGGDLTVSTTTFNIANTTATTVNAFGAATAINFGASGSGTTTFRNNTVVGTETTQNLFNSIATTVNFAGAATTVEIGAATGTTNINNNLDVDGDVNIDGGDLTVSTTTFNLANTNATTVNFAGAATTLNIGNASTEVDFGDLRIVGSTIYSDNASAQTITIDPYPAGGDAAGNVVVRGNLQVSGTTTTVNSTQMTINDPIFTLGDSISEKTVVSAASSGQADITLDDVEGLNVGDIVSGNAAIPNGTTISAINTGTKVITLSANLTTGIAASTNTAPKILTFTQGADDNRDRGIEFKYFNGSLKTGFFGYDESGISEDTTNYYFTYIPDATNTNNVFTGTVGSAYFKTVKLDDGVLNGVAFFDQYKRLTRTVAAGTSDATTSNQILTVNGSGVPVWTTTLDGGTY